MVTGLYAALCVVMLLGLNYNVILRRLRYRIGLGTGGNDLLERAVRQHGNFTETVPFVLLLMALAEHQDAPGWALHLWGITLLLARGLHFWGLSASAGASPGRTLGTALTHACLLAGAAFCLWYYV